MMRGGVIKVHIVAIRSPDHKILWIASNLLAAGQNFAARALIAKNEMDQRACISYIVRMSISKASISKASTKVSMGQLGGLRGLIRNPSLVLLTLWRRRGYAGEDTAGNLYFERPGSSKTARPRRWVVYAGAPDASSVTPEWHAWLHYLTDAPLAPAAKPWQRPHQPNLTGTASGYRPAGHDYEGGQRAPASADYESWTPDNG
jgi:NADH:ubiquinone oxidoreductase subunit